MGFDCINSYFTLEFLSERHENSSLGLTESVHESI